MAKNNISNEVKVLIKVFDSGYKTEKEITSLTIDKILAIENITVNDISMINELQKAIKSGKTITFLGGGINGEEQQNQ